MTLPQVTITEIDGALGVLPASEGALMAFVGPSTAGEIATPVAFARVTDAVAYFGAGPLVEAAGYYITATGRPALMVRSDTAAGTAGEATVVVHTGTGTSVATVAGTSEFADDWEVLVQIVAGGTIATAGITYRVSYDGGRSLSPVASLGIANSIDLAGGLTVSLSAGTMVAGDTYAFNTTAPIPSSAEVTAALTALGSTMIVWEQVFIVSPLDADTFDAVELKVESFRAIGKYRSWIGGAPMDETDVATLTGMFGSKATTQGSICAGACKLTSGVSGRKYRRSIGYAIAAAQAVSHEIDIADVNLGSLPGVAIRDANGNIDEHDESVMPGLDDARFITLRTWDGYLGVYVTRPRIFSVDGSDFQLIPHRRVLNLAEAVLRNYFIRRLNRPIRVDPKTGFILEADAREIEGGALAAMRSALLAVPKASGVQFILSRTDNILSTNTLTGTARVIPLAYPEYINIEVGFYNPALAIAA